MCLMPNEHSCSRHWQRHMWTTPARCWLLKKCMFGALLAAAGWQHLVQKDGTDIGLPSSSNCPCAFWHSWLDMVMTSLSLEMVMTSTGCHRNWMRSSSWCRELDLGRVHDNEAAVLNRCVAYSDSWTHVGSWPATRGTGGGWAWTTSGETTDEPGRCRAKCTTGPWGTGTRWAESPPQRASKTGISDMGPTWHCIRLQGVQSCSRGSNACWPHPSETCRTIRTLHATCRVGVPAATRREHCADRWTLRCWCCWLPEDEALDIWRMLARWSRHLGNLVVNTESGVTQQRGVRILQHGTLCKWFHRFGQHGTRAWTRRLKFESRQMLQRHADWLSEAGAAQSILWKRSTFGCSRELNQEDKVEKIRGTVNPADLVTRHLDGKRLAV